jgi:glycosyltransferase involved in cell wall biosynthesis
MEAHVLGVPAVATATGGVPNIVISGQTGFVSAIDDVDELARHCIALLTDRALANRLGKNAVEHVKQFADIQAMAGQYLRLAGGEVQPRCNVQLVETGHDGR